MTTHGPISEKYREKMHHIAKAIDQYFNGPDEGEARKTGFALLVFPFGAGNPHRSRINYLSNANRDDMIVAMKELLARFEGHDHDYPSTKV